MTPSLQLLSNPASFYSCSASAPSPLPSFSPMAGATVSLKTHAQLVFHIQAVFVNTDLSIAYFSLLLECGIWVLFISWLYWTLEFPLLNEWVWLFWHLPVSHYLKVKFFIFFLPLKIDQPFLYCLLPHSSLLLDILRETLHSILTHTLANQVLWESQA